MTDKTTGRVYAKRILYQPTAHCSICDWHLEDSDARKMRREARKHCGATAHDVWIDWNTASKYVFYAPAPGEAEK